MAYEELLRRINDLHRRCERANLTTSTAFLTPAEQAAVGQYVKRLPECRAVFCGGTPDCERKAVFFLPDYLSPEDFEPEQAISGLRIEAFYGTPCHRDYLGALLALGVRREWIGDIWVKGQCAWVFCLPSVAAQLAELKQVGRIRVKTCIVPLREVPTPSRKRIKVRFTVQSLRLDAVLSETFKLSRSQTVKLIAAGYASLNYLPCLKNDAPVSDGDVISLKGCGKATIAEVGGQSRKGRLFVQAEVWV